MIDIRKHPQIAPFDPADVEIKCALEGCIVTFPYGDGWKINASITMPGDRNLPSTAPNCEHVCCSLEHAIFAISTCMREHVNTQQTRG